MAQIATTREQSKRLLELGISRETADMSWHFTGMRTKSLQWELKTARLTTKKNFFGKIEKLASPFYKHPYGTIMTGEEIFDKIWGKDLPAWSLRALIRLLPDTTILYDRSCCGLSILNMVLYYRLLTGLDIIQGYEEDNIFKNCVRMIAWLVNHGYIQSNLNKND